MSKSSILFLFLFLCIGLTLNAQKGEKGMDLKKMEKIFKDAAEKVEGESGVWQVHFLEQVLLVITDENANRMRIFTPIAEAKNLDVTELRKLLMANFHSALDAKYSLYNDFVISTFTHPLQELTEAQLVDAMKQVATLAKNYGTTYSSTDLIFGGGAEPEKKINEKPSRLKKS